MKKRGGDAVRTETNSINEEFPQLAPLVGQAFEYLLSNSNAEPSARARRILRTLIRFGHTDTDLMVAAVLSAKAGDADFNPVEIQSRFGAKVAKTLSALKDASQERFSRVLPLLSISNPEAAVIKVAAQIVDVEAAVAAVAVGQKEPWLKYREQFKSTLEIRLPGTDDMWNELASLCQSRVPTQAFQLGDVYIDYSFESVKVRFDSKSGKTFSKFYGKSEYELPRGSNFFRDAREAGELISRDDYTKP